MQRGSRPSGESSALHQRIFQANEARDSRFHASAQERPKDPVDQILKGFVPTDNDLTQLFQRLTRIDNTNKNSVIKKELKMAEQEL